MVDTVAYVLPDLPVSEGAQALGSDLLRCADALDSPTGFWLAWLLAPGLQVSHAAWPQHRGCAAPDAAAPDHAVAASSRP